VGASPGFALTCTQNCGTIFPVWVPIVIFAALVAMVALIVRRSKQTRVAPTGGAGPPAPAVPQRRFRIDCEFTEDDVRYRADVSMIVERDAAPDRAEAERLIRPVVHAKIESDRGDGADEGGWRPYLRSVEVTELTDDGGA
jgi:hypothetical protein